MMANTVPEEAIGNEVEREVGFGASVGWKGSVKRESAKVLKAGQGEYRESVTQWLGRGKGITQTGGCEM